MEKSKDDEKNDKDIMDELENFTEEELDKMLNEQAQLAETLENLNENSDYALKIYENLQKLNNEKSDIKYQEKSEEISQSLSELKEKIKPLQEKVMKK